MLRWISALFLSFLSGLSFAGPTLEEKIGQMLIFGFDGAQVDEQSPIVKAIQDDHLGGVILFDYDAKTSRFDKNIKSEAQLKKLILDLKTASKNALLPLIVSIDYEGGEVSRLSPRYGFMQTHAAADLKNLDESARVEELQAMAQTLHQLGINLDFAPVVDLNLNPENPIIAGKKRSYSADADEVTHYALAFSRAMRGEGVQCVYKHFPGHGSSSADSHLGFVDVSNSWSSIELTPYKNLIATPGACGAVLSAHVVNKVLDSSGLPASLSKKMLTDILRGEMQFKGVIITDDLQMKAIADHYSLEQTLVLAINAGNDILVFGNNIGTANATPHEIIKLIVAKVHSGDISEARINESYQRISDFKNSMGISQGIKSL